MASSNQDMKLWREYPFTARAILVALAIALGHVLFQHNLFNSVIRVFQQMDASGLDELIVPVLLIGMGNYVDVRQAKAREHRDAEIQKERLRVLQATMRTVHDIVNNSLNNLQLFRMDAERGALSRESLNLFDEIIHDTAGKLRALGEMEDTPEMPMATGAGIDYRKSV